MTARGLDGSECHCGAVAYQQGGARGRDRGLQTATAFSQCAHFGRAAMSGEADPLWVAGLTRALSWRRAVTMPTDRPSPLIHAASVPPPTHPPPHPPLAAVRGAPRTHLPEAPTLPRRPSTARVPTNAYSACQKATYQAVVSALTRSHVGCEQSPSPAWAAAAAAAAVSVPKTVVKIRGELAEGERVGRPLVARSSDAPQRNRRQDETTSAWDGGFNVLVKEEASPMKGEE